jgi:outer membrane protein assembly factor BamB
MVVVIVFSLDAGAFAVPGVGAATAGGLDTRAVGQHGHGFAPPLSAMGSVDSGSALQNQSDWATAGHDAGRSGYNPNAEGPKTNADARWVYEADNQSRHEPAVVADSHVFVPTRDGLRVLDNETGVEVWNATDVGVAHVSVSGGVAVATSGFEREVRASDATTGEELWNVTNFDARTAVVSNGTVYVE